MIVQGSNNPLVIQFDASVEDLPELVITLWVDTPGYAKTPQKKWTKEDMQVEQETVICPITEEETRAFPTPIIVLEAKGLDEDGNTVFWDEYMLDVKRRRDRVIALTQTGG